LRSKIYEVYEVFANFVYFVCFACGETQSSVSRFAAASSFAKGAFFSFKISRKL